MKKIIHPAVVLVAAIIAALFPVSGVTQVVIGTGPDLVNLVIQAPEFGETPLWYEYHYNATNFTDPTDPIRGSDVLVAVDDALSNLSLDFGGSTDSGFFVNSLAHDGGQPVASDFLDNRFWTYFVAGGAVNKVDGSFSPIVDDNGVPIVDLVPAGAWSLSPVGASLRYPVNGSWDALVFGKWQADPVNYVGDQPAVTPIPEPSGVALLLGGVIILAIRWIGFLARAGA